MISTIENRFLSDCLPWLEEHKSDLLSQIQKKGALLLKSFHVANLETFSKIANFFEAENTDYSGGASPRKRISETVFTATEMDPSYEINFHNELAYAREQPLYLIFHCRRAASKGGYTSLCSSRDFIDRLPAHLFDEISTEKVSYVRRLRSRKNWALSEPWEDVFLCETKKEVEQKCRQLGYSFAWENDTLIIKTVRKLFEKHPVTEELVFFSSLFILRPWFKTPMKELFLAMGKDSVSSDVTWENGDTISFKLMEELYKVMKMCAIEIKWKKNDILFVDNFQFSHSRHTFEGNRELYVSLCKAENYNGYK